MWPSSSGVAARRLFGVWCGRRTINGAQTGGLAGAVGTHWREQVVGVEGVADAAPRASGGSRSGRCAAVCGGVAGVAAAGSPGYRELARRAHYSVTTLAQAAWGEALPSLAVTLAYVRACGGDAADWEARWRAAADELEPAAGSGAGGSGLLAGGAPYVGLAAFQVADRE